MHLIPPLRADLDVFPIEQDGEPFIILRDPLGFSDRMMRLRPQAWALLMLMDGSRSAADLCARLRVELRIDLAEAAVVELARALADNLFLDDARYRARRQEMEEAWRALPIREAVHAGASYSDDAATLGAFLQSLLDADRTTLPSNAPLGVVTPHIDLQVGPAVYVPAMRALGQADFDTVVILGTSHYSDEDAFILTSKHYRTPLGVCHTDIELVERIRARAGDVFTHNDIAHRPEHSIEFPVLFLQQAFADRRFRIVPVLCTSMEAHLRGGSSPREDARYRTFIDAVRGAIDDLGRRVVYLMSVDWSHIGRKFGDERDAREMLGEVRASDHAQLEALVRGDHAAFEGLLRASGNATRIDGYACITTFFDLAMPARGALLAYEQWHEEERASAVTFAAMSFHSGHA
jgi:MEMO1 family protein